MIEQAAAAGRRAAEEADLSDLKRHPAHRPGLVMTSFSALGDEPPATYVVPILLANPHRHPTAESVAWKDAAQEVREEKLGYPCEGWCDGKERVFQRDVAQMPVLGGKHKPPSGYVVVPNHPTTTASTSSTVPVADSPSPAIAERTSADSD